MLVVVLNLSGSNLVREHGERGEWSTYRANSGIAEGATLARRAGDMGTLLSVGLHRKSRLSSFRGMRY
jgi:hypothetical protein